MVKLVPEDRALSAGKIGVVLQITPSLVPSDESNVSNTWLFVVTAVVSTTRVFAPAATATLPPAAEPQTAGDELELQFVEVPYSAVDSCPALIAVMLLPRS